MITRLVAALLLLLPAILARAEPPALELRLAGEAEVVFAHRRDACGPHHGPDAPARAVRLADGSVVLFAAHIDNRPMRGPSLWDLRPDCTSAFRGAEDPDPARFDDRGWIAALWTADGRTLHAVIHNEHQGHRHPGQCPSGRYRDCWYNALTAAVTTDGARSFHRAAPPPALVAALPHTAAALRGRHAGWFNPTGILAQDGGLVMLAFAEARGAQRRGNCLMRTTDIADPAAWRGFDGTGFTVRFADPYRDIAEPTAHACTPVAPDRLRWPVTALVRHAPSGLFLALMQGAPHPPEGETPAAGIYYATSPDLLRWSAPALLLAAPGHGRFACDGPRPVAYPSLLDAASPSRSFETVGETALLFLTRFEGTDCRLTSDRSLLRWPVALRLAATAPGGRLAR